MKRLDTYKDKESGKYCHSGDCWIYAVNGVCTCGLMHIVNRDPDNPQFEHLFDDWIKHESNLHWLNHQEIPPVTPMSEEELLSILSKIEWNA